MPEYVTHARLSPSGSKRWMSCPGSVTLEAPFPDTSNRYSDDGTAMHAVAAWCLTEHRQAHLRIGQQIAVHDEGEEPRFVEFTDAMAQLTQEYVDTVRVLGIGNKLWIEQRVEFSDFIGVADQFGTADAIVYNERDGELMLVDLKTGYRFVDAEENSQLMLYALGALKQVVEGAGAPEQASAPTGEADAPAAPAEDATAAPGEPDVVPEAAAPETAAGQESEEDDELW